MSENRWENSRRKKINYMANRVWDGLNITDIERFLNNFGHENKIVGLALLDMLIYYSSEQEQAIVNNLIRLLERDIWLHEDMLKMDLSSVEIRKKLIEVYKKMCLVPVHDSDLSDSAFSLTSLFKKNVDIPKKMEYVSVVEIPVMLSLKYKYIVFYDDLIGTGNQFKTFWNEKRYKKGKIGLEDLAKRNPDVDWYYLALGGCEEGINQLKRNVPNIKVIVSEYLPKSIDIFSNDNEYWEMNPDIKALVLQYVTNKENELRSKSDFSMNLPVLFQHGRASNSALSLYWFDQKQKWKALYKR